MRADHIIKFHTDHPFMSPKLLGLRLTGAVPKPIGTQESILKGVKNLRNFVGQMPKIVKAKKSVAGFKLRKDSDLLVLVTIRNKILLNSLTDYIIFTLLEESVRVAALNSSVKFGLSSNNSLLDGAGLHLEFFFKGSHPSFIFSQLLLPIKS